MELLPACAVWPRPARHGVWPWQARTVVFLIYWLVLETWARHTSVFRVDLAHEQTFWSWFGAIAPCGAEAPGRPALAPCPTPLWLRLL